MLALCNHGNQTFLGNWVKVGNQEILGNLVVLGNQAAADKGVALLMDREGTSHLQCFQWIVENQDCQL